jgi:F0F1-type ATP synthase membrane subunit b/b'
MKTPISAFLAALAVAGLCTVSAYAGDGDKEPTSKPGEGVKAGEGDCCKDKKPAEGAKAEDGKCEKGEKKECGGKECGEGQECCKQTLSDLDVVTLAAVEGASESAKKVLASVPAAALEKVEAARKSALEHLAKIHASMDELHAEYAGACSEAKAKGAEVCGEMKATFERDMKALHGKAKEQIDLCARAVGEALGEEKVKQLSAECRKAGDVAKAAVEKVKGLAAKIREKASKKGECEAESECEGEVKGECPAGKDGAKPEEKKPAGKKDPQ